MTLTNRFWWYRAATFMLAGFFAFAFIKANAQVLDKREVLDRFKFWHNQDWDWYIEHIPFFESPDRDIDLTYYYRWELITARMVYGSPQTGYISTEFTDRPWWSGTYGAISCAAGHQLYEYRWLRDRRYFEDYARYWFRTEGAQPRNYSAWIADAVWQGYQVYANRSFTVDLRDDLVKDYAGWEDEHWVAQEGLFAWDGMHDGMETNINSRQTKNWFSGAPGYRPTLNSYMWANARAIGRISQLMGDDATASLFSHKADVIKHNLQTKCWDADRNFFFHRFQRDEGEGILANTLTYQTGVYAGSPHGRELHGYVPWYFRMPDSGYESAWQFLTDSAYFYAPFGPTTVEKQDPLFNIAANCCAWSGNAWPFATSQTLKALANVIKYYDQPYVTKMDYVNQLKIFARTHRKDGKPYIAEANHPETGLWAGHDHAGHSEHYFHSAYIDEVITGLVGFEPTAADSVIVQPLIPDDWDYFALDDLSYHGRRVSVVWDMDGTRYGNGKGLMILVDGEVVASAPAIGRLGAPMNTKPTPEKSLPVNYAVNNSKKAYPMAMASYPGIGESTLEKLIDGQYWYYTRTPNQWHTRYSSNKQEWVGVDFGVARPLHAVKIYFVADSLARAPRSYELQYWKDGDWHHIIKPRSLPQRPTANRANTISFDELVTSKIRVLMKPDGHSPIAVSELEAWGRATNPMAGVIDDNKAGRRPAATVSASYTSRFDRKEAIIDGVRDKSNRWTAYESPNEEDWVQLDFDEPQSIAEVRMFFYNDNKGVRPPVSYTVTYWDGQDWQPVEQTAKRPALPIAGLNICTFAPVAALKLRITMTHQGSKQNAGLYEVEWLSASESQ